MPSVRNIADQAPDMLDETVIRNTNTKIIFRLPDENDFELVGKSIALTDVQIEELAKLPVFVAVVHQNDWIEVVICKSKKYDIVSYGTEKADKVCSK